MTWYDMAGFLANSSLEITLLVQKCYFISDKLLYLWHFQLIQLNKWEQMILLPRAVQYKNV